MIDFDRRNAGHALADVGARVVVDQVVVLRRRDQSHDRFREWSNPVGRDDVSRRRIRETLSVYSASRVGIINFVGKDRPPQRIGSKWPRRHTQIRIEIRAAIRRNRGKVAVAKCERRNRVVEAEQRSLFESFETEEEETLLLPASQEWYRAAQRSTEIMTAVSRMDQMAAAVIRVRKARVQSLIHKIFVAAAVKLAGARFHRNVEETATRLSEFGSVVAGLNRYFLNGIGAGLVFLQREAHRVVRLSIPSRR